MLIPLRGSTLAAGGVDTLPLNSLPKALLGRICHVRSFLFELQVTPTFTTAPTTVGNNNTVKQCDFWDGSMLRFQGGFNHLRCRERIHWGRPLEPESQTATASGSARYIRRRMYFGPPQMANAQSDFLIPTGALENGEIRLTYGALTDLSTDTTAFTGLLKVYADIVLLDEVRVPPAVQFFNYSAGSPDYQVPGRALYMNLFMLNSSSFDAIAAGDFGNITVDLGQGPVVQTIPTYALTALYQSDIAANEVNTYQGEPRGATDNNARTVDHASSTALATAPSDLQPVIFTRRGEKLSKLMVSDSSGRISWDGTQATAVLLLERVLSQPPNVVSAIGTAAVKAIGKMPGKVEVKTLSKDVYTGPYGEFFPWKIAVS